VGAIHGLPFISDQIYYLMLRKNKNQKKVRDIINKIRIKMDRNIEVGISPKFLIDERKGSP